MRPGRLLIVFFCIVLSLPPIADCQQPKATEKFVLSKAALLSDDFPEGVHEVLDCAHGYNRVNGSGTTACTNGQWSEPDLICEGKPPTAVSNDRFLYYFQLVTCFTHREQLWPAKTRAEHEIQYQRGHSVPCKNESVL